MSAVTTSSQSDTIFAYNLVNISGIGVFTAGPGNGTISLQASNDFDIAGELANFQPTNWVTIAGTTASVFSTSSTFIVPALTTSYHYLRFNFTTGTGTSTMDLYAKGNGW